MIKYCYGDLLKSKEKVIVHGCNCSNGFASGFAGQVAQKYPEVKQAYHAWYESHIKIGYYPEMNLGPCSPGEWQPITTHDGRTIINLISQRNYGPLEEGPYVSYQAIKKGFESILKQYNTIAMPKIGAGLAGGNWDIIEKIINKVSGQQEVRVYIYDKM